MKCGVGTLKCVRRSASRGYAPERVVAGVAFQLLWALAYLHHEKRLHRDIKPTNILVNRKGRVKLTDFGKFGDKSSVLMVLVEMWLIKRSV
jgi:serine/threonine protein kinase